MPQIYFIAGTDTGVGKTYVSCALLQSAMAQKLSTAAIKPVAAGAIETVDGRRNDDALALQQYCSLPLTYGQVNPVCLQAAIAPHLAAAQEGLQIEVASLESHCRQVMDMGADLTLIEGAGGWMLPLNEREFMPQLVARLQIPVILVVGMRLGCLNHALLTARAIQADGLTLAGWVANHIDPDMEAVEENLASLEQMLPAPMLASLPFKVDGTMPKIDAAWIENVRAVDQGFDAGFP